MSMDAGICGRDKASLLLMIVWPSKGILLSSMDSEPVARMILPASNSRTWPFDWTLIRPGVVTTARPSMCVILFAFIVPCIPFRMPVMMASRRCWILAQFGVAEGMSMPMSPAWRARSSRWAEASKVLDGMQPQFRQVPPTNSFSTIAVEAPRCAPPLPP